MLNGAPIANLDLDGMATKDAIKVLHATALTQQGHLEALHADISEIKTLAKSIRLIVSVVPVVVSIIGGVLWILSHVKVIP